jgi:hypothetical protein
MAPTESYASRMSAAVPADDLVCGECGQSGSLVRAQRLPRQGELQALDSPEFLRVQDLLSVAEVDNTEQPSGQDAWFHASHVPSGWQALVTDR